MKKLLNFDEALELISDERQVRFVDVSARALRRKVWVSEWHLPGCISESRSISLNKQDAIAASCSMAETEDGPPRGMKAALRSCGAFTSRSQIFGVVINTIEQVPLAELVS